MQRRARPGLPAPSRCHGAARVPRAVIMLQLAKRANRTHRIWISEDLRNLKPATYTAHREVADLLVETVRELRRASSHVGQILVKES